MTADTLRAAAQRLRALADQATADAGDHWIYRDRPRHPGAGTLTRADIPHQRILHGPTDRRSGGPYVHTATGVWMATLDPAVGRLLADWFDHEAAARDRWTVVREGVPDPALELAWAVLDEDHINPEATSR